MAEKVQALLWCDPARRPRPAHAMARAAGEQHLAPSHLQLAAARLRGSERDREGDRALSLGGQLRPAGM